MLKRMSKSTDGFVLSAMFPTACRFLGLGQAAAALAVQLGWQMIPLRPAHCYGRLAQVARIACVLVFVALLALEAAAATTKPRLWTRSDGVQVTGVFVAVHGSVLALKEIGGRNVFWSWAQVSAGDRAYLAREHAVVATSPAAPQAAGETRQQAVAARMAKINGRAELLKTEPGGTGAVLAP